MNWDAIGAVGEIVGALAVILSLGYVGVQIKQNTNASRSSSYRSAKSQFNAINTSVAQSAELTVIMNKALRSYNDLDEKEKSRAGWVWLSYTNIWETLYHESRDLTGHDELWKAEERTLLVVARLGGYWEWWQQNQIGGTEEFRNHIEQLMQETK
tara:strand:+ start:310 stop:774 length:465 start_codon:yes stop_codon:yes gene_type:complete